MVGLAWLGLCCVQCVFCPLTHSGDGLVWFGLGCQDDYVGLRQGKGDPYSSRTVCCIYTKLCIEKYTRVRKHEFAVTIP